MTTTVPTPGSEATPSSSPPAMPTCSPSGTTRRWPTTGRPSRPTPATRRSATSCERAEAAAASAVNRGEQQTRVFEDRFSQVASGERARSGARPAGARRQRAGPARPGLTRCGSQVGRVVGAGGSAVFHRLTALAGRGYER